MNWYNYVGGDPVNGVDPLGLEIVVTGTGQKNCIIHWNGSCASISDILQWKVYDGTWKGSNSDRGYGPPPTKKSKECSDIMRSGAFDDPIIQRAAERAMMNALFLKAEFGFWVIHAPRGTYKVGTLFTTGDKAKMGGDAIMSAMPANAAFFVHVHPNNPPPSRTSGADAKASDWLGLPVVAYDKSGRFWCTAGEKK